jgi:hypothetical protein
MPMQPIHRLADLGQRPDGGVEWACPQCGRYLIRYPNWELVVAAGVPGPAHILGPGSRNDPAEGPSVSEFDQQFLHSHAMAWSADQRPNRREQ